MQSTVFVNLCTNPPPLIYKLSREFFVTLSGHWITVFILILQSLQILLFFLTLIGQVAQILDDPQQVQRFSNLVFLFLGYLESNILCQDQVLKPSIVQLQVVLRSYHDCAMFWKNLAHLYKNHLYFSVIMWVLSIWQPILFTMVVPNIWKWIFILYVNGWLVMLFRFDMFRQSSK